MISLPTHIYPDSGRLGDYIFERKDCTVRTLAAVTGKPYAECHALAAKLGRKPKKAFCSPVLIKGHGGFINVTRSPITLNKFISRHPVGRFYVRMQRHHALAVVDSVIYDNGTPISGLARVRTAWRYNK